MDYILALFLTLCASYCVLPYYEKHVNICALKWCVPRCTFSEFWHMDSGYCPENFSNILLWTCRFCRLLASFLLFHRGLVCMSTHVQNCLAGLLRCCLMSRRHWSRFLEYASFKSYWGYHETSLSYVIFFFKYNEWSNILLLLPPSAWSTGCRFFQNPISSFDQGDSKETRLVFKSFSTLKCILVFSSSSLSSFPVINPTRNVFCYWVNWGG